MKMRGWLFSLLFVSLGCGALCRAEEGEILLSDDFSKYEEGWGTPDETEKVADNKLIVNLEPDLVHCNLYRGREFSDADIRLKVTEIEGDTDQVGGIAFWAVDPDNRYIAVVTADGELSVARRIQGKWTAPVLATPRDEVLKGVGQANELRVVTTGSQATIYVNGKQVTSFRGFPPQGGGRIGIHAESGEKAGRWAFSELVVRQGRKSATVSQPPDESLLFAEDFQTLDPSWGKSDPAKTVQGGKLILKPEPKGSYAFTYQGALFEDADISVKVTQTTGATDQFAGLLFWLEDFDNYYYALVQPDGKAMIARRVEGEWKNPLSLKENSAVNKGLGATNELRVVTMGESASLYINNVFHVRLDGYKHPALSKIGLKAESGDEACAWAFSELRVRKPLVTPTTSGSRENDLLLTDDFRSLQSSWGPADEFQSVSGNKLLLTPKAGGSRTNMYTARFGDADIRVKLAQTKGTTNPIAGIVFWGVDFDNFYEAFIRSDGNVGVMRRSQGEWLNPVQTQPHEQVHTGLDQPNELRVVTSGKLVTLYVNDRQVASFRGFPPTGGALVGLRAESGTPRCTWAFSDFSVRQGPAPPNEATPADESLLFADDFGVLDPSWGNATPVKQVRDHELVLRPEIKTMLQCFYNGCLYGDADISVNVTEKEGETSQTAGIIFWAAGRDDFSAALIGANGTCQVVRYAKGNAQKPVRVVHDAVRKGVGQSNQLRVVTKGKSAEIYVNDQKVADYQGDPPPHGGRIGLGGGSDDNLYTWAFSDLVVRKPK